MSVSLSFIQCTFIALAQVAYLLDKTRTLFGKHIVCLPHGQNEYPIYSLDHLATKDVAAAEALYEHKCDAFSLLSESHRGIIEHIESNGSIRSHGPVSNENGRNKTGWF